MKLEQSIRRAQKHCSSGSLHVFTTFTAAIRPANFRFVGVFFVFSTDEEGGHESEGPSRELIIRLRVVPVTCNTTTMLFLGRVKYTGGVFSAVVCEEGSLQKKNKTKDSPLRFYDLNKELKRAMT